METLLSKIFQKIKKDSTDLQAYKDLAGASIETLKSDVPLAIKYLKLLSECIEGEIKESDDVEFVRELYDLHLDVLQMAAPYDFESYLLFVESEREPEKKFYPPRRKALKPVVEAL